MQLQLEPNKRSDLNIGALQLSIPSMRKVWMSTSSKLEAKQTTERLAAVRATMSYSNHFNSTSQNFDGKKPEEKNQTLKAAVLAKRK